MKENDQNDNQTQVKTLPVTKPKAVTVFGYLNCIFGGMGILFSIGCILFLIVIGIQMIIDYQRMIDKSAITENFIYYLFNAAVLFAMLGFSTWTFILGIGLVKFRKWSRRGAIVFAWFLIVIGVLTTTLSFAAWESNLRDNLLNIIGTLTVAIFYLPYPVLHLIFMKTQKVKNAFAALG